MVVQDQVLFLAVQYQIRVAMPEERVLLVKVILAELLIIMMPAHLLAAAAVQDQLAVMPRA